jgi:hypothetical protein
VTVKSDGAPRSHVDTTEATKVDLLFLLKTIFHFDSTTSRVTFRFNARYHRPGVSEFVCRSHRDLRKREVRSGVDRPAFVH